MAVLRRVAVVVTVLASVLTAGAPAWAHNELRGVVPAKGATLPAAPAEVVLEFAERLDPRYTRVAVAAPGGQPVADGKPRVDGNRAAQPLRAGAGDGTYTVVFRVVSLDGHPVQGRTTFTVRTPAPATTPATTPAAVVPSTAPASAPPSPAEPAPAAAERRTPGAGWLVTVVLLLLLAAGGVLVLRRRRGSAP